MLPVIVSFLYDSRGGCTEQRMVHIPLCMYRVQIIPQPYAPVADIHLNIKTGDPPDGWSTLAAYGIKVRTLGGSTWTGDVIAMYIAPVTSGYQHTEAAASVSERVPATFLSNRK